MNGKLPRNIEGMVEEYDYLLAKFKFVKEQFPGCRVSNVAHLNKPELIIFSSRKVNSIYTNYSIFEKSMELYIEPYVDISFEHGGESLRHECRSF